MLTPVSTTVEQYFQRIGITPPVARDAEGLVQLQRAHLFAVPFENLDIHMGRRIVLDETTILDKIIASRRGGFCYELNTAFCWLLHRLGYRVDMLGANVFGDDTWGIDFDHMLLRVELDQPWILDVGFGDNFVDPLRLQQGLVQEQDVGAFRLDRDGPYWILMRKNTDQSDFTAQYRFMPKEYALADFQPGCDYHQSPASHFTKATVCSLARPEGRITLRSDRLIRTENGVKTESAIDNQDHWRAALREHFAIVL